MTELNAAAQKIAPKMRMPALPSTEAKGKVGEEHRRGVAGAADRTQRRRLEDRTEDAHAGVAEHGGEGLAGGVRDGRFEIDGDSGGDDAEDGQEQHIAHDAGDEDAR